MIDINVLVETIVYLLVGVLLFGLFIWILEKTTTWSLKKELIEDENVALGILIGCLFISLAIIIAAAIHG